MTTATEYRAALRDEAVSKLRAYANTGMAGFLQQGTDRARELGHDVSRCRTPADALRLIEALAGD
jgi:hypothetical protein